MGSGLEKKKKKGEVSYLIRCPFSKSLGNATNLAFTENMMDDVRLHLFKMQHLFHLMTNVISTVSWLSCHSGTKMNQRKSRLNSGRICSDGANPPLPRQPLKPHKVPLLVRRPRPGPDISDPSDIKKSGGCLSTSLAEFLSSSGSQPDGAAQQQNISAVIYMKLLACRRRNSICLTSAVQSAGRIDSRRHGEGLHSSMWLILCTLYFLFLFF